MRISDLSSDMCSSDLPSHYDIAVTPDAKALTFTGRVAIDLDLFESSTIITMNALDLAFTSASIAKAGNSDAAPLTVTDDAQAQTVIFTAPKAPAPRKYRLPADSPGIIKTQTHGQ